MNTAKLNGMLKAIEELDEWRGEFRNGRYHVSFFGKWNAVSRLWHIQVGAANPDLDVAVDEAVGATAESITDRRMRARLEVDNDPRH